MAAYQEAQVAKVPNVVQVASLLHDVGYMLGLKAGFAIGMDECDKENHEGIEGEFLQSLGLGDNAAWLVANHINAKHFLVLQDPNYELSLTSCVTLHHQGGPMTDEEAQQFMEHPYHKETIDM